MCYRTVPPNKTIIRTRMSNRKHEIRLNFTLQILHGLLNDLKRWILKVCHKRNIDLACHVVLSKREGLLLSESSICRFSVCHGKRKSVRSWICRHCQTFFKINLTGSCAVSESCVFVMYATLLRFYYVLNLRTANFKFRRHCFKNQSSIKFKIQHYWND